MHSQLIQFVDASGTRRVGALDPHGNISTLRATDSIYSLAERALSESTTLQALAAEFAGAREVADVALAGATVLSAADHPVDEARCTLWDLSDGITCLGDGSGLGSVRQPRPVANFNAPLKAAVCAVYLIDLHRQPCRLGFSLGLFSGSFSGFALGPALLFGTDPWLPSDSNPVTLSTTGTDMARGQLGFPAAELIDMAERRLFSRAQCRRTADLHIVALTATSVGSPTADTASLATPLSDLPLGIALSEPADFEVRTRVI